jgi:hypothetical protein
MTLNINSGTSIRGNLSVNLQDIVKDGLVLYLDAGNRTSYPGTGTTWTDLSGYGNNATLTNGPIYSTDGGGSIYFDGSDDYAPIGTNGFPFGSSAGTLSSWTKRQGGPSNENIYQWFITYGTGSPGRARFIGAVDYPDGAYPPALGLLIAGGYAGGPCPPGSIGCDANYEFIKVPELTWFNLTGTYDGQYARVYYNGILYLTYRVDWNTLSGNAQLARQVNGSEYYNGYIATAYNYNRALSDAEVLQNFNAKKSRFGI